MSQPLGELLENIDRTVRKTLTCSYTSYSSVQEIPTGNHYQSVRLGDDVLPGFRSRRDQLFSCLDFSGRCVLDIGSNLGENARLCADRGASRVYAVEYDPLFSALSGLILSETDINTYTASPQMPPSSRLIA